MSGRAFYTILCWQDGEEDCEVRAKVSYDYSSGYAGDRIDPPEESSVEIASVERTDPGEPLDFARWQNDADLIAECLDNEADEAEAAAECAAEQRQEMRMMDWLA